MTESEEIINSRQVGITDEMVTTNLPMPEKSAEPVYITIRKALSGGTYEVQKSYGVRPRLRKDNPSAFEGRLAPIHHGVTLDSLLEMWQTGMQITVPEPPRLKEGKTVVLLDATPRSTHWRSLMKKQRLPRIMADT